ncbi:MAG: hypothetical protein NTY19_39765 [Planctomycetota bacterium]|nr:hypothetical protein [Planctomycetota bacterium]
MLTFSYIDSGVTDAEITVSGSSELVLEPTPMLDKPPRRDAASKTATRDPQQPKLSNIPGLPQLPADMELPDMPDIGGLLKTLQKKQAKQPASGPATGQGVASPPKTAGGVRVAATPITVAEQKQARATLWVGDNTYKLEHGVAYETKLYDEPVTEVLLAVKPIAVDKLVALLRQGKDAGDAIAFEPHVKLRFDASGKLAYLFLFADGLSVNLGNPEPNVVKAEVTVKDGRARGTAVMDKPGALFKQQYRIDATFDAKLATGPAAASDAATE